MRLRTRVERLSERATRRGLRLDACPACRHRCRAILVFGYRHPDESITWDPGYPLACTTCGKIPEQLIQVVSPWEGETLVPTGAPP